MFFMDRKKIALVTGAYGAIGFAISKELAFNGFEVILVGKSERRLEEAVLTIQTLSEDAKVWYEVVDISRKDSIIELKRRWDGPLDVLVNNAATTPRERSETLDGLELQFATNIMGYFWMMHYLNPFLKLSTNAQIVNIASYWTGGLDISDLQFKERVYDNDSAYRQSKQANRMLTVAFAELFAKDGICVNSCHPGDVNSKLSNNLGFGGHQSPEEAATTAVWLAKNNLERFSGKYFENKKEVRCGFSQNKKAIEDLYRLCLTYV